jgi:hypothetical protein
MSCLLLLLTAASAFAADPLVTNGGFEAATEVQAAPSSDIGFGLWTLGPGNRVPADWALNPAYPGEVSVPAEGAHSGSGCLRLRANGSRGTAHVFQPCAAIQAGRVYTVSVWVRGGPVNLGFYEYWDDGRITIPTVVAGRSEGDAWRELRGYYMPAGAGFKSASLAIMVPEGVTVDVDDVQVEESAGALPEGLGPITLQTDWLRLVISPSGRLTEFTCLPTGTNYAVPDTPVFRLSRLGGETPVRYVKRTGDTLEVRFADPALVAYVKLEARPHYLTLTVDRVEGEGVDSFTFADLRLQITENVGPLINAAWNDTFGTVLLGCTPQTDSAGADGSRAALTARCYREYGFEGAKVALVGVPLQPAGSTDRLLDMIEEVELDQGLPHPMIDGVWIRRSPKRHDSYLMAGGVTEENVDQVVEFAKGGFGCIELLGWWNSTPAYGIDPGQFPRGLDGLKAVAVKIHAAGLQVGLHCMQGMVGWGGVGMRDPYVSPKADPRLLQDRHATLAADVAADATELPVTESLADWPDKGDLLIDGEIVRYARHTDTSFVECQRGLHGTTVSAHPAGAAVGHLVNVFPMWGSCIYAPDVNSTMVDETCDHLAAVFNAVGADMSYFDGGEEIAAQPPHWRNQGRIALGVQSRLKKPVILEGNALYTQQSWHVITRGSPTFDPIYWGRRDYTLRGKGQNPAGWAKNLLTGDVGWFAPHVWSPSTDAVTPDEVMLLCLKALAGKAPISFQVDCNNPYANRRMPEMLEIIRTCDELKRRDYFSPEVRRELARPMVEHLLEATPAGGWQVSPLQYGPVRVVDGKGESAEWTYANPHSQQRPWLRIRARSRLAPYGSPDNLVLADCAESIPFALEDTASTELTQSVEPSPEKTPDGASAFCYRAKNAGQGRSAWTRLSMTLPKPLDLTNHRRLGLWVRGDGAGGILNVQLVQGYGFRDHYIPLDYTGWRYQVLDPPEDARFYNYSWPYGFIDVMYWVWQYSGVSGVNLYYNDLPAGTETACLIGRIEALREYDSPLVSPALECAGQTVTFPASLKPEEYVEVDWSGACRHFDLNGGLLEEVKPQGELLLAPGDNRVRFTCDASNDATTRAEVTLCVKGEPLANQPPPGATAQSKPRDDTSLALLPGGKRGFRLMRGPYELAGGEPQSVPTFDGRANTWTVASDRPAPQRAVAAIMRTAAETDVDFDDPQALTLESFDDLPAYEMGNGNDFEKYVIGGGKQLAACGPVREGVTQTFVSTPDDARAGRCGVYSATNAGPAGGWSGKGKRFSPVLDLSKRAAIAFWLRGDGKREALRFQFRDVTGQYADWVIPIDFTGWRLQVLSTADRPDFDWTKTEYVIFYFNDIPAGATVSLGFDDVKAVTSLRPPPALVLPELLVNDQRLALPVSLAPGQGLTIDDQGRCIVWPLGPGKPKPVKGKCAPIILQPGENRVTLSCDTAKGAPRDTTVRLVPLGPR